MYKCFLYASLAFVTILECFASIAMNSQPIVIAHRGASGYLPEHTLPAVAMAHGMGADYMEPDVVLSKDAVPVVLHDIHLDATTNVREVFPERCRSDGRFYAIDFTVAEIKSLTAQERVNIKTNQPVYPGRFSESSLTFEVPTLEEYIVFLQALNQSTGRTVGIYPELKAPSFHLKEGQDMADQIIPILAKYGYVDKNSPIFLQCFDPSYLKTLRFERGIKLPMIQLIGPNVWQEAHCDYNTMMSQEGLKEVATYADGIGIYLLQVKDDKPAEKSVVSNLDVLQDAKNAGLKIHVYTLRADELPAYVKTLDELHHLLFNIWHVDGVFTDFTDKTVHFLRSS